MCTYTIKKLLRQPIKADLSVHGGLEKAVYVYPEHDACWREELLDPCLEELSGVGVMANRMCPGPVKTEFWDIPNRTWRSRSAFYEITIYRDLTKYGGSLLTLAPDALAPFKFLTVCIHSYSSAFKTSRLDMASGLQYVFL